MNVTIQHNMTEISTPELQALVQEKSHGFQSGPFWGHLQKGKITQLYNHPQEPYNFQGSRYSTTNETSIMLNHALVGEVIKATIKNNLVHLHYSDRVIQIEGMSCQGSSIIEVRNGENIVCWGGC